MSKLTDSLQYNNSIIHKIVGLYTMAYAMIPLCYMIGVEKYFILDINPSPLSVL